MSTTKRTLIPWGRPTRLDFRVRPVFLWLAFGVLVSIAGYTVLPTWTSNLMISVIEWKAKVRIQYEKRETRGFFWVKYSGLSVQRTENVRILAREAVIRYNILHLIFKHLNLRVYAKGIQIRSSGPLTGKSLMESFEFTDLESKFKLATRRRIRIDYLRLSGPAGSIFLSGRLQERVDVDLRFACFLARDFLLRLPKFIQENLFRDNELPLKHFRFSLQGKWSHPSIDFQSDLVEFNFKARE